MDEAGQKISHEVAAEIHALDRRRLPLDAQVDLEVDHDENLIFFHFVTPFFVYCYEIKN